MEIPLRHLPPGGRRFEERWRELTVEEKSGLRGLRQVAVRLTARADRERVRLAGRAEAVALATCSRCLAEIELPLTTEIDLTYGLTRDYLERDPDAERLVEGAVLDPLPEIVGLLLSELPFQTLCRPDCRGLCPTCGADLNQGACTCRPAVGSPFEILKTLRTKGDPPRS
ncbi:MAG: DUF177 domain-containing protein [Nitrospirae bacterium]|nr:MAG: DUF177 domain-containing protein [Nitrospirota bacterium]